MPLFIGGVVYEGATQQLCKLLEGALKKRELTVFLVRSFKKLWLFPEHLAGKIADFLQPPTYYIDVMMNFVPDCSGYVTPNQVLKVIAEVWNKAEYDTWWQAPKNNGLVVKIFADLYYRHTLNNMPRLAQEIHAQKRMRSF